MGLVKGPATPKLLKPDNWISIIPGNCRLILICENKKVHRKFFKER